MTELAYEGVTVVDMSQGVAGPYCAAMLGLHGATTIKVEPPDGDWIRVMGGGQEGLTALAIVSNLGKRSICLDAKKPEGRALIEKMVSKADVLVENFRPGVMQKLGLDYAALRAVNPRLVYLSITGFGESGPWAAKAGTDSVLQAYTGMATLNKEDSGRPRRLGMLVPDTIGALYAVQCVGAALYARTRTGQGRQIKVSLAECCAAFQAAPIVDETLFADRYKPPIAVPSGVFATADGFFVLLTLRNDMWERFCRAIGRDAWVTDPRYATNEGRGEHSAEINRLVGEILSTRPSRAWVELLEAADVLCAEVQSYAQLRDHPQMKHMGYFGELQQPPYGPLAVPYLPGTERGDSVRPAPRAGQHTRELLRELGYSAAEIAAMEQSRIVVQRT
jgi:crotonobetainyl-CoA:carnitine CoA-transferase CaiB-like acyl-CoA transferase